MGASLLAAERREARLPDRPMSGRSERDRRMGNCGTIERGRSLFCSCLGGSVHGDPVPVRSETAMSTLTQRCTSYERTFGLGDNPRPANLLTGGPL